MTRKPWNLDRRQLLRGAGAALALPLLEGMTGVLNSTLPEGTRIDRAVMVVWSRSDGRSEDGRHEAGLRFF